MDGKYRRILTANSYYVDSNRVQEAKRHGDVQQRECWKTNDCRGGKQMTVVGDSQEDMEGLTNVEIPWYKQQQQHRVFWAMTRWKQIIAFPPYALFHLP